MAAIVKLVSPIIDWIRVRLVSIYPLLSKYLASLTCLKGIFKQDIEHFSEPDLSILNCRVALENQGQDDCQNIFFNVQICGTIFNPTNQSYAKASISITDVTDGIENSQPVQNRLEKWRRQDCPAFVYSVDIGNLPEGNNVLSGWVSVAKIYYDWLNFPRKGTRDLRFEVSILSGEDVKQLACANSTITCEIRTLGYNNLSENAEKVKILSGALAFAVSAIDNKLYRCEIETIKKWARDQIDIPKASKKSSRQFEKAFDNTVRFFRKGYSIDINKICKEIVNITSPSERYDILELCLHVARANGRAASEETYLLEKLAKWLEVDMDKFRTMMEKILPVTMHEVENIEVVLGVTHDMDKDEVLHRLNNEYRKWNARAVNIEPEIQSQAEHMLDMISRARNAALRENL